MNAASLNNERIVFAYTSEPVPDTVKAIFCAPFATFSLKYLKLLLILSHALSSPSPDSYDFNFKLYLAYFKLWKKIKF
jgi:hypothetical protein